MSGVAATPLMQRGQTYLTGDPNRTLTSNMHDSIEGTLFEFPDNDPTIVNGARVPRSNRKVLCMLVRNLAAFALEAKRVVKWKAGGRGKQVDGYCAVTDEACAGVVDEFLGASGCPVNDMCWLTVKGPTLVKTSLAGNAENVIAADARLGALTGATSGATTAGRVVAQVFTGATQPLADAITNGFARALSAATTANTNSDLLIDTYFLK